MVKNNLIEILSFIDTITIKNIKLTRHFIIKNKKRHVNKIYNKPKLYEDLLVNSSPVEISLQKNNIIRIKYIHPYCDNYDYCIVFVREGNNIKLITTMNTRITKRIGRNNNG